MAEWIGITVLWMFLYGYLIVASIDFGAGFFSFYEKLSRKPLVMNQLIGRYLSPVWEVTNVFFVFFFVGIVGFFPDTAYYYGTALLIPGSLALVLLAIRGSFYAFNHYGAKDSLLYSFIYGATGLLIPAALSTAMTISEGGYIVEKGGRVVFLAGRLLTSFYSWSVVLLALVSVLFISAAFLTYYAAKAEDEPARRLLRQYTLFWSLPTILASVLVFIAMEQHNFTHFQNMLNQSYWFLLSLLFFLLAVWLIFSERHYGTAFFFVMLQFFFAFFGYGATHLPFILYPYIKLDSALTLPAMSEALMIAFVLGLVLLIPSLVLLMRLFVFDAEYVKGKKK
ncbi:MAG TPA: cytochrome d ubiquinol oxidase subunit II [Bacillales bacterium]|nr:cytochrome d ubiquinol oxidase subunit II [Bacillales bacterium]